MVKLKLSGVYTIFGNVHSKYFGKNRECFGQFFILQIKNSIIGRGRLIYGENRSKSIREMQQQGFEGLLLNLFAKITHPDHLPEVPFEGHIVTQDGFSLNVKNEIQTNGRIIVKESLIELDLRDQGELGKLYLLNCFDIGDFDDSEIWGDYFRSNLMLTKPFSLFLSHEKLEKPLYRFLRQSHFDKNVFVMMRFQNTDQNKDIRAVIRKTLAKHRLIAQFADNLIVAEELWDNVCTYMLGSRFGIAVIEEIEERSFNPNVAIETGFMLALQKRVLVLKDKRVPRMPADLIGRVYREFDSYRISETIERQVNNWIEELKVLGDLPKDDSSLSIMKNAKTLDDEDLYYK
jgi:hypothetical protein